jgi:hypothetical protein
MHSPGELPKTEETIPALNLVQVIASAHYLHALNRGVPLDLLFLLCPSVALLPDEPFSPLISGSALQPWPELVGVNKEPHTLELAGSPPRETWAEEDHFWRLDCLLAFTGERE